MTIPSHTKNPEQKIVFQKFEKLFRKNIFWEKIKISDVFWKFKLSKFEKLQFLNFGGNGHLENFQHFEFHNFQKSIGNFYYFLKNIFSEKFFEFLKKYILFRIFCVTRYGYVVCKNYNLSNLQASQQRTARHTLKTSRILADSFAVPHRDVLLLFTPSTPPE